MSSESGRSVGRRSRRSARSGRWRPERSLRPRLWRPERSSRSRLCAPNGPPGPPGGGGPGTPGPGGGGGSAPATATPKPAAAIPSAPASSDAAIACFNFMLCRLSCRSVVTSRSISGRSSARRRRRGRRRRTRRAGGRGAPGCGGWPGGGGKPQAAEGVAAGGRRTAAVVGTPGARRRWSKTETRRWRSREPQPDEGGGPEGPDEEADQPAGDRDAERVPVQDRRSGRFCCGAWGRGLGLVSRGRGFRACRAFPGPLTCCAVRWFCVDHSHFPSVEVGRRRRR